MGKLAKLSKAKGPVAKAKSKIGKRPVAKAKAKSTAKDQQNQQNHQLVSYDKDRQNQQNVSQPGEFARKMLMNKAWSEIDEKQRNKF